MSENLAKVPNRPDMRAVTAHCQDETARPLDPLERRVLAHLLSVPFDGAAELRQQVANTIVTGAWGEENSPSIDLSVPGGFPRSPIGMNLVPVRADVTDPNGEYRGELLLWLTDGALSALEYAWVTDVAPQSLPDIGSIQVSAS